MHYLSWLDLTLISSHVMIGIFFIISYWVSSYQSMTSLVETITLTGANQLATNQKTHVEVPWHGNDDQPEIKSGAALCKKKILTLKYVSILLCPFGFFPEFFNDIYTNVINDQ